MAKIVTRTYALIDLVGLKADLKAGKGADRALAFWKRADAWTNGGCGGMMCRLEGENAQESGRARVVTFSDSLLFSTASEYTLIDFYKLLGSLRHAVIQAAGPCYCVVSRGPSIEPPALPALGGTSVEGGDLRPAFLAIAGTGPAFADLFFADAAVQRHKAWHGTYSLYATASAIPSDMAAKDSLTFKDLEGNDCVLAALA